MPIKTQYLKSKPQVKVTFEINKDDARDAQSVVLLSEHNNWQPIELKKFKNGKFKVSANIATDNIDRFQFTYKAKAADGHEFMILPEAADEYVDNGITDGGRNAVLILTK